MLGGTKSQAVASQYLGRIAAKQGDVGEALERYQEALKIFQALQNPRNIADTLKEMGKLFIAVGAYDAAKETLIQSVQIAERIGNTQLAAANYNALGLLSEQQDDFISAKIWFAKAASMSKAMGDERNAAVARRNLERVTDKLNGGK